MEIKSNKREPIPTIPDEPMTRPSGIRSLAPNTAPIPEEIKEMVRNVMACDGDVEVRRMTADPIMIKDAFQLMPGGGTPIVSVSRVAFTDGDMTSISGISKVPESSKQPKSPEGSPPAGESKEPASKKITHSVMQKIDGANYIAVVHHSNSYDKGGILLKGSLEVYAREPRVVYDFIDTVDVPSNGPADRSTVASDEP